MLRPLPYKLNAFDETEDDRTVISTFEILEKLKAFMDT